MKGRHFFEAQLRVDASSVLAKRLARQALHHCSQHFRQLQRSNGLHIQETFANFVPFPWIKRKANKPKRIERTFLSMAIKFRSNVHPNGRGITHSVTNMQNTHFARIKKSFHLWSNKGKWDGYLERNNTTTLSHCASPNVNDLLNRFFVYKREKKVEWIPLGQEKHRKK